MSLAERGRSHQGLSRIRPSIGMSLMGVIDLKISWNPSWPCLRIEGPPICFSRSWISLAWGRPSPGRGDVWPLPETNPLILVVLRLCKSGVISMCGSKKESKNKLAPAHGCRKSTIVRRYSSNPFQEAISGTPHHHGASSDRARGAGVYVPALPLPNRRTRCEPNWCHDHIGLNRGKTTGRIRH